MSAVVVAVSDDKIPVFHAQPPALPKAASACGIGDDHPEEDSTTHGNGCRAT
jgi:hypothetical protein